MSTAVKNTSLHPAESTAASISIPRHPEIEDVSHAKTLYLERYVNGTRTYSKLSKRSELAHQFRPDSDTCCFPVPRFLVDRTMVQITTASPTACLAREYLRGNSVVFCVHPQAIGIETLHMEKLLRSTQTPPARVVPTSSSRTVFVIDPKKVPYSIKLHLPVKISRFNRRLGPKTTRHSIYVTKELDRVHKRLPKSFAYLPETIGIAFPSPKGKYGWGFIIREMTPFPAVSERRLMIPFFSLYGKDESRPEEDPLLVQMIKKSGQDPKTFVLENIIFPVIECWIKVFKETGILMETHGQNTLLEVDENFHPTRIVHRDFDNSVDARYRQSLGLSLEGFHPGSIIDGISPEYPKGSEHSLIFDSSVSHHMLDFLAATMEKYFGISPEELQTPCKQFFQEKFSDYYRYFPPTVYYYADKSHKFNTYPLINTGKTPSWRPALNLRSCL